MPKKVVKKKSLSYRFDRTPVQSQPVDYEEVEVRYAAPVEPPVRVVLAEPDPLDPQFGLLFLLASQRILAFAQQAAQETPAEPFIRSILARVCLKDPRVKLILAVADGEVLGHVLATIETDGISAWAFCWQAQVDPKGSGLLQDMMDQGIAWAKQHNATSVLMATHLDPTFWQKKYGFESIRTVMRRPI